MLAVAVAGSIVGCAPYTPYTYDAQMCWTAGGRYVVVARKAYKLGILHTRPKGWVAAAPAAKRDGDATRDAFRPKKVPSPPSAAPPPAAAAAAAAAPPPPSSLLLLPPPSLRPSLPP